MLSELYGRIGQMLRENGDAPIGNFREPMFPNEPHLPIDYIEPLYCTFTYVITDKDGAKIRSYELLTEK